MEFPHPRADDEMDILAINHLEANDPYEPYNGVQALFNADLNASAPDWAPRADWQIRSRYEISYQPVDDDMDSASEN